MWTMATAIFSKHTKWIIAGALLIATLIAIYMAITNSYDKSVKAATKQGAITERAVANEKVIEDVQKANDNANTPTTDDRKRRLCEKYDRNRADCQ